MKIILSHNYFYIRGGAEVFYREVGRVLEEHGHEVAYFSPEDTLNLESPWSSYFPSVADYQQGNLLKKAFSFGKMIYSQTAKNKMSRLIHDFQPDIVHFFATHIRLTPSVLDACREHHVPVVMSCNDAKHICPNYMLYHHSGICEECKGGRFYRAVVNKCSKNSLVFSVASSIEAYSHAAMNIYRKNINRFLFASEFMAHKTEEFWGKDTFRWNLLRNPFNSTTYNIQEASGDYLLYFGRLTDEKGVDVLIKAMKLAPHVHLRIVGDGPQLAALELLVKTQGISNVTFLGPKWGAELNAILKDARFVVVPSVWHENFPYVILQSFAFGKAVIGTNRGGIPELIKHGEYGFIYPAQDTDALANYISTLWNDPSRASAMGKAAKKWADEEFNDNKFYNNLITIYQEVLHEGACNRR